MNHIDQKETVELLDKTTTDETGLLKDHQFDIEHEIEVKQILHLAVIYNDFQVYLVKSDIYQNDNDIEITEEQYNFFLDVNNRKQAELRVIELEDGKLAVKDFYNPRPSFDHFWNKKTQAWAISKEDQDQLQIKQNTIFLSMETQRTNTSIEMLNDAVEFEIATDEEINQHKELRKYRILLSRVPNQKQWPLDAEWPACPEFFKTKE